ncbi:MAG TPA: HAD family hydrolase [Polyangiaceae bacterium]|nr:HAD family hydrolase [Polyangiaceae bacterium]
MLRAVLFDLDGTLSDRDSAMRELFADQHQRFAAALQRIPCGSYVARMLELDAHGHCDKAEVYSRAVTEFALSDTLAAALLADFWSAYHGHCRCFADVLPALRELRRRGLSLGIITNGVVRVQEPAISHLGLNDLMDTVHISEHEGVRKPDVEIFRRALRALDVRAEEACFVGDDPDVDVRGAADAGLTPVWRRTTYWKLPTVRHEVVDDLGGLLVLPDMPLNSSDVVSR